MSSQNEEDLQVGVRDDVEEDFAVSDSRSEAEMELLKALRSIK